MIGCLTILLHKGDIFLQSGTKKWRNYNIIMNLITKHLLPGTLPRQQSYSTNVDLYSSVLDFQILRPYCEHSEHLASPLRIL
mmetsp:Transcript_26214/g.63173  ORF Transcript_26214/g.63173 Transcript_26214/m.63173 type:complete len:82 (+) Transcript_26214:764-1009(+)